MGKQKNLMAMKTLIQIVLICAVFQLQAQEDQTKASNSDNSEITTNIQEEEELITTALGVKRSKDEISTAYKVLDSDALVKANNPNIIESLSL